MAFSSATCLDRSVEGNSSLEIRAKEKDYLVYSLPRNKYSRHPRDTVYIFNFQDD